jgi:hypothetical protein
VDFRINILPGNTKIILHDKRKKIKTIAFFILRKINSLAALIALAVLAVYNLMILRMDS